MKEIESTKTEQIVLSIIAYSGGTLPADDIIMLAEYIQAGNEEEVNTTVNNLVGLKVVKKDDDSE